MSWPSMRVSLPTSRRCIHSVSTGWISCLPANTRSPIIKLTNIVNKLSAQQPEVLEQLRPLERKLGLVLTLFKVRFSSGNVKLA